MPSYLYHVIANIDTEFDNVNDCLAHYIPDGKPMTFRPTVPVTHAPDEDISTPRIPVCRKLTDCFSGIGIGGRFRRCLGGNDGAKTYSEGMNEAYPILVCKFDDRLPVHTPTKTQVPDIDKTNELWLTEPAAPLSIELKWLDNWSITWKSEDEPNICKSVKFVSDENLENAQHPWLTGIGNILESSLMDHEWYKSKYRTPMDEAEKSAVRTAYALGIPLNVMRTMDFPHRSMAELCSVVESDDTAIRRPFDVYPVQVRMDVETRPHENNTAETIAAQSGITLHRPTKEELDDTAIRQLTDTLNTACHDAWPNHTDIMPDQRQAGVYHIITNLKCSVQASDQAKRIAYKLIKDYAKKIDEINTILTRLQIKVGLKWTSPDF